MTDDAFRRAYWTHSMEQAARFLDSLMDYPVEECGEPLVSIPDAAAAERLDVECSDTPIVDDVPRIFEVREGVIPRLLAVARTLNARGLVLKLEEGFRTADMQRRLGRKPGVFDAIVAKTAWEAGGDAAAGAAAPAPDPDLVLRRASVLVANLPKVAGHMAGCAIDISVLDRDTRVPLDRGGPYLEMSERTPMASPFVAAEALGVRAMLTALMETHGFVAYPWEFWHYSAGDVFDESLRRTGRPARYAAVHRLDGGRVEPVADLAEPLHRREDVLAEIRGALARVEAEVEA